MKMEKPGIGKLRRNGKRLPTLKQGKLATKELGGLFNP